MARATAGGHQTNISDVARTAGVSVGTVSNVLNNPHRVAEATRLRVEEALRSTGYVRNAAARQLSGAASSTVGCVVLDLSNPYFAETVRGIEDGLAEQGCLAIMCSTDSDPQRERWYLQMLLETRVRSIILNSVDAEPDVLDLLVEKHIPVTLLDNPRHRDDVCAVTSDHRAGGRLIADHLLDQGHRRIALLRGEPEVPNLASRVLGAYDAARARGLRPDEVFLDVALTPQGIHGDPAPAIDAALAGPDPCTAMLCYNDMTALAVLTGLRERGIAVPEQMSVTGYDDLAFARTLSPALTTVRQPTFELGRAVAQLVLAESDDDHEHREVVFEPELIVRESTAAPSRLPAGH